MIKDIITDIMTILMAIIIPLLPIISIVVLIQYGFKPIASVCITSIILFLIYYKLDLNEGI